MTRYFTLPVGVVAAASLAVTACPAADLFTPGNWSALAADRKANVVGDSLTVLVFETSTATNSTSNGTRKDTRLTGELTYGSQVEGGGLDLSGGSEGEGQTGRSGRMVAQIGVVVDAVLPNGDLRVSGEQVLKINGETTRIKLRGRVRPGDIGRDNAVVSNRLADVTIDYDGSGFLARSARPGILGQIFSMLGLM